MSEDICKMILQRKEGRKQAEPAYCYPIVRLRCRFKRWTQHLLIS